MGKIPHFPFIIPINPSLFSIFSMLICIHYLCCRYSGYRVLRYHPTYGEVGWFSQGFS